MELLWNDLEWWGRFGALYSKILLNRLLWYVANMGSIWSGNPDNLNHACLVCLIQFTQPNFKHSRPPKIQIGFPKITQIFLRNIQIWLTALLQFLLHHFHEWQVRCHILLLQFFQHLFHPFHVLCVPQITCQKIQSTMILRCHQVHFT